MLKRTYKIPDTRGLAIAKVVLPSSKVLTLRWDFLKNVTYIPPRSGERGRRLQGVSLLLCP